MITAHFFFTAILFAVFSLSVFQHDSCCTVSVQPSVETSATQSTTPAAVRTQVCGNDKAYLRPEGPGGIPEGERFIPLHCHV